MRYQGCITVWKDDKGYGFISPDGGGEPVFVHIRAFPKRQRRPNGMELVTYELGTDVRGRARANNVAYVGAEEMAQVAPGGKRLALPFAIAFLAVVAVAVLLGHLPLGILLLYLVTSLLTFFAYAFDKSAARRQQWRTPESTLHLLALVGGWPGALAAQQLLRHKSAKSSFLIVYWLTVLLNCAALGWLFSVAGKRLLQGF